MYGLYPFRYEYCCGFFFFFEDYKKVILVLEIVISGLMSELQLPSQHPEVAARGPCHMVGLENKPRSLMTLLSH